MDHDLPIYTSALRYKRILPIKQCKILTPILRVKGRPNRNNYLLTGNKVQLFSRRLTRDVLLPEQSDGNNRSRVKVVVAHYFDEISRK